MRYVLDTNAVAALMRSDPRAVGRLQRTPKSEVAVPQPVVAEIRYGLARLPRSRRRAELEKRWELFERELVRAPWTDEVSQQFGTIKASLEKRGDRLEDFDIAIAAHALAHDARLVTANTTHLTRIAGLQAEDWTEESE